MWLAADGNQLLRVLYVPRVAAFQLNSTLKDLTPAFFFPPRKSSRVELKGIFQEVALEPVEWFYWLVGLSRLRCLLVFARVVSVPSAKLFRSSSLIGLETFLMLLNSEYPCVSTCCFSRGDGFLPWVGIVLGYPVMPVQKKRKLAISPLNIPQQTLHRSG